MVRHLPAVGCAVTFLLASANLVAQRASFRVTAPSPTAASLGKFGDVPVSLYSGTPEIRIPLFTAKGKDLELPIALNYHAAGIKVEEIGGWVGIGWALEAGGSITRSVRGLKDEDIGRGYYYTGNTWYDPNKWPNPTQQVIQSLFQNLRDEYIDGEPDQFSFNFAGRSGQFALGPTSQGGPIEYRAIPHQKLHIEPTIANDMITAWTITAEDGTVYVFGAVETSTDYTQTSSTEESTHWGQAHASSWHLTSITSPGGDVIGLEYAEYFARHRMGHSREKFDFRQVLEGNACVDNWFDVWSEFENTTLRLTEITTAAHTITFTPGPLRTDALAPNGAPQEPTLDKITVATASGTVLRVFQFGYDYSTGRLTLKSVAEKDRSGASLPPYTFNYDPMVLPPRTSYAMDHWGFFNGQTSNTDPVPRMIAPNGLQLSGANREPSLAHARAGVLTKVTYPTGGYNEFVYELNNYGTEGSTSVIGYEPSAPLAASAYAGPAAEVVEQQFTVASPDPQARILVSFSFSQDPVGCAGMDDPPCPMTEVIGVGGWQTNGFHTVLLAPGTYTLRATTLAQDQQAQITASWQDQVSAPGRPAGGLRVVEIRANDAMNNTTTRKYVYTLSSDPSRSSGTVSNKPIYAYQYNSQACSYFSRSSMSRLPLGDGAPVGYREVTVWHGPNAESGKTRHTFRSFFDVTDPVYSGAWPAARRTNYAWMRGQETGVTELNTAGQKQRRTAAVHEFRVAEPITYRAFRGMSINTFSAGLFGTTYIFSPFEVLSVWTHMSEDTTVIYSESGADSIKTVRTSTYANPNHIQLTQLTETNSDGTQRITRMKYPADYTAGSGNAEAIAITAMQGAAHIHNAVIERWVSKRVGSVETVLQAELTTFKAYPTGRYLPYQRFTLNSASGLP